MKKIGLLFFLGMTVLVLSLTAINASPAYAQPLNSPSLEKVDHDVAKSLLNARLAMRDVAECNLYMLGRIAGILSQEKYNLMRLQGYTFDKVTEMAQRLHEIMSEMERLMPGVDGPEKVALETAKSALGAAGLVPGFGAIAYGASTAIQIAEIGAQIHNATQAADIAEGIKQNAQAQLEAFQGAVDLYNDITQGIAEIDAYQKTIQDLLDTYEKRCLKKGGDADQPTANIVGSPAGSSPEAIEDTVHDAVRGLDECDLPSLIALNNVLTTELNKLYAHQQDLFSKIMTKSSELEAALNNLEQGLPQMPNLGWEAVKAGIGAAGLGPGAAGPVAFGAGLGSQIIDMQGNLDRVRAEVGLKEAVRQKMQELHDLVKQHTEVIKIIKDVREHQEKVQDLIETWEERCLGDDDQTALRTGDGAILIGSDNTEWCTYGYGGPTITPVTPIGGGTFVPTGGDNGGTSAPPPGIPPGSTPGGPTTPPPPPEDNPVTPGGGTTTGDDQKDEPTRPQTSGPPGTTFIPLGGGTPEKPEDDGDDPRDGPELIIKAKQSVLQSGGKGNAVAGQQIKLFADSTVNVALPGTRGAKKNDADHDAEPLQCTTGKNGECRIPLPAGTFQGKAPDFEVNVNVTQQESVNVQVEPKNDRPPASMLPGAVQQYATDTQVINGKTYVTLTFPASQETTVRNALKNAPNVLFIETNYCRDKQPGPDRYPALFSLGGIAGQAIYLDEAR